MDLSTLFKDGRGTHGTPLPMRKSLEVLPGVYSWDPAFLAFQRDLSELLNKELPEDLLDEEFVGESGVHTDFDRLRSVAGYSMNPISYVPIDNAEYCASLGLPSSWRSARHRQIAENVWRLVFSCYKPSNINLPKHSTSGFTEFTYDAEWKRGKAIDMIVNRHTISSLFRQRDMESLATVWGILFAFNLNKREQVEAPSKKRLVFTLEDIYGNVGEPTYADKRVVIDSVEYPDFTATRSRVVQGGPWPVNFYNQVVATGHMYALFDRFPKTFHHVDSEELCARFTQRGDVALFDVTDYDRSIQKFMYDTKFKVMREFWAEWLVDWAEHFHYAAYYARPLDINGGKGTFVGDPLATSPQVNCGNRSGDGFTSLDAKVMKVIDTLTLIDDLMHDVVGNEARYLDWEMPIAIANNGDDEGITGHRENVRRLVAMRELKVGNKLAHGYFLAALEKGQIFSGELIHRRSDGTFVPIRRIHTMLEKTFIPERPIGGVFRKYWFLGITDRATLNEGLPAYNTAMDCVNACWKARLLRDHGTFWGLVEDAVAQSDVQLGAKSSIDRAVLYDSSKLFHQYVESDVDEEVLKLVVERIKY